METIKQKIEGQSTKDTKVAPVVLIVTEEEYIELFGTESYDETFDGDWSEIGLESTRGDKARSVGDNCLEAAESDGTKEGIYRRGISLKNTSYTTVFRIKNVLKIRTRKALELWSSGYGIVLVSKKFRVRSLVRASVLRRPLNANFHRLYVFNVVCASRLAIRIIALVS